MARWTHLTIQATLLTKLKFSNLLSLILLFGIAWMDNASIYLRDSPGYTISWRRVLPSHVLIH